MLRQRIVTLVMGIALMAAIAGASATVADSLLASTAPQAIACHASGSSGGGC